MVTLIGHCWIRPRSIHQPTRPKLMHGHVPVFSLSSCPPRGDRTPIRTKKAGVRND
ncbi:hypothetical protein PEX1_085060 [Penicillium expansum]|uniref:Uncharacterized protein n=1 Tax=Penicillium expansum TaxID=27334 RepID=A0A0A2K4I3_PENEN|nr:hypothetical protein PEX2_073000 [Penicillium expansum]KGO36023.1 hypothetical protein PEXP_075420 [Penicillium expansum]KGO52948.1 hypothetical protein PEX1_085060 [Penicillium expansum]KGO59345.1 hypothetical protein PEX2_073000 [Penicillium expansum]